MKKMAKIKTRYSKCQLFKQIT